MMFRAEHGKTALYGSRTDVFARAGSQVKAWATRTHDGLRYAPFPEDVLRRPPNCKTHTCRKTREGAPTFRTLP